MITKLIFIAFLAAETHGMTLQPGSPLIGAGTPINAPTTDFCGNPRPNPPAIGAFDINSGPNCENTGGSPLAPPIIVVKP